jgi:hypothetical protein
MHAWPSWSQTPRQSELSRSRGDALGDDDVVVVNWAQPPRTASASNVVITILIAGLLE